MNSRTPSSRATAQMSLTSCRGLRRPHAVRLAINLQVDVADHVEQHAAAIPMRRRIGGVLAGKMLAAEKIRIALAVIDQLFAVEQARNRRRTCTSGSGIEWASSQSSAVPLAPSFAPMKTPLRIDGILIGKRPRVVVGTEQNPLVPLGMPLDDQVGQPDLVAVLQRMAGVELLQRHLAAQLLEMGLQIRLLPPHPLGRRDARADRTDFLEIA